MASMDNDSGWKLEYLIDGGRQTAVVSLAAESNNDQEAVAEAKRKLRGLVWEGKGFSNPNVVRRIHLEL